MSTTGTTDAAAATLTARSIVEANDIAVGDRLSEAGVLDEAAGLLSRAGSSLWEAAYGELTRLANGFLEVDITAVMVTGWCKYRELIAAGEQTAGNRESVVVELAGRDLSLVQHPQVDVMLLDRQIGTLTFDLLVDVKVVALAGIVRDGALVELTSGTCEVTVTLSFGSAELAKATGTYDPHVAVSLGEGVPLTDVLAPRSPGVGLLQFPGQDG